MVSLIQLPRFSKYGSVQVMAPFTPFFCESLYQNLRRALPPNAPQSVHWCDFPEAAAAQVQGPRLREWISWHLTWFIA